MPSKKRDTLPAQPGKVDPAIKQKRSKPPAIKSKSSVALAEELSSEDVAKLAERKKRSDAKPKSPKFKVNSDPALEILPDVAKPLWPLWAENVENATGFKSGQRGTELIVRVAAAISPFDGQTPAAVQRSLDDTAEYILEMKPADATEAMLVGQMIVANNAALDCMRRAMINEQTNYGREEGLKFADRLMRTYALQLEALTKYRKGGQQKVIVEHVHVYPGGQAIVGTVNNNGGGGDEKGRGQSTTCGGALEQGTAGIPLRLAEGQEVWCEVQEDRPPLPTTGDA